MRGPGARAFGLVFVGTVFFRALGARAEGAAESGLRIEVANCPEELAARLPSVVKLEIDVLLRERGPTRAPPQSIAVRCEEDRAHIEVQLEGANRASTIELRALAAEHRARAIGLATAELVHSMSSRASVPGPPAPAAATAPNATTPPNSPEPPGRPADALPRRASQRPALLVGGLAQWLGKPAALLFGARAAFHYPLGTVVVPALSIDGSLGGIASQSAHVAAKTLSAAAHLYFGATTGNVRWEAGPGARFGWVHLAGQPDAESGREGRTLAAAWGGPELRARLSYGASSVRSPLLALELGGGFVTLPVRGLLDGTARVYAVEGTWMSICAEVGFGP